MSEELPYPHEIYCSADRKLEIGCDGCSCRAGIEIKRLRRCLQGIRDTAEQALRVAGKGPSDMTDPIRSLVNELSGFLGVYSHDMRYAAGNTNVAVLQEKLDAAKAALGVAQGPSDMTNPDALAESPIDRRCHSRGRD